MNVDISPDGKVLVFDLLGDIYRLPIQGGDAVPLTTGRAWDHAPRFSQDGKFVYFVSDREGHKNIWRLSLTDQSVQQVTFSNSDILGGPNWTQGDDLLLVGLGDPNTRNSEVILQSIDPNNGGMTPIHAPSGPWIDMNTFETFRPAVKVYSGVESADGEVFFSQVQHDQQLDRRIVRLYKIDLESQTRIAVTSLDTQHSDFKPQLSHDGRLLAYFRQYADRRTEIRILNRETGQDEARIELTNADDASYSPLDDSRPNYAFTPDDRQLVFWHGGKIHRVDVVGGASEVIPFRATIEREVWARAQPAVQLLSSAGEAKNVRWPSVSRDGQTMVFSAIGYVWVMDFPTGEFRRLTDSDNLETMPALSPDGRSVAYISFAETAGDYWPGSLMVSDVKDGTLRELLATPTATYLLPRWSTDGSMIAVIREVHGEHGIEATFGWTAVTTGAFEEVASAPVSGERANFFVYARFVGFDEAGLNLLFSFPRTMTETVLATAALGGGPQTTLAIGTSEVGGITPAPDLKNLVLTRRDGTVWVVPFDAGFKQSQVSTSLPDARRISTGGGYYVSWSCVNQIIFGFGTSVYRYKLDRSETESVRLKLTYEKPKTTQPIAFTGARIITMSDSDSIRPVIESGTIVLDGLRIAAIGPVSNIVIPSGAFMIDATDKTIIPGLLDTHYHSIGGNSLSAFALPNANVNDQSAIRFGITTAWEPGGAVDDGVPAIADLQRSGRISGPRWSHSAMGAVGYPWAQLTNYAAASAAVEQHQALGVAVLKEYNTPTREQQQWLAAAAHANGMGIVSHLQSFDGMMTRIVDGYTGGDHPYMPMPLYKDVHELLRQTGYIWTPNIGITSGTIGTSKDKLNYFCNAVLAWQNRNSLTNGGAIPACPGDQASPVVPYNLNRVSNVAEQAASAASNGVHIGVSAHNMPGSNLHREMWFLWRGGMPTWDVLRAATIGNAEKLGLQEEIGSLEPGKIADFLVLNENPLEDILNTLTLKYTVQGGVVYDSGTTLPVDPTSVWETNVSTRHEDE